MLKTIENEDYFDVLSDISDHENADNDVEECGDVTDKKSSWKSWIWTWTMDIIFWHFFHCAFFSVGFVAGQPSLAQP